MAKDGLPNVLRRALRAWQVEHVYVADHVPEPGARVRGAMVKRHTWHLPHVGTVTVCSALMDGGCFRLVWGERQTVGTEVNVRQLCLAAVMAQARAGGVRTEESTCG